MAQGLYVNERYVPAILFPAPNAIIKSVADGEMQATLVTFFGTETFLPSMSMTVIEPPLLPPIRDETAMPMTSDSDRTKRMGSNFFILNIFS